MSRGGSFSGELMGSNARLPQAITVAIDQYAETALGNRDYFLNKPYSIGGGRSDHVP